MLGNEQLAFFKENGFIILDNFISETELGEFREALRRCIRAFINKASNARPDGERSVKEGAEFDDGIDFLESIDHEYVASTYDTISQVPEFLRIVAKKQTEEAVNQLLGREINSPLYGLTNRCLIFPPWDDRRSYGWHQEVFSSIPETECLQTWAPLVRDTTEEDGTIEVCVGSHLSGISKQIWENPVGKATQITVDQGVVNQYEQRVVEMQLGQMLIFTPNTIHRSGKNISNQVRYSLVGIYNNVDSPAFAPPKPGLTFRGMTNREYYDKISPGW